MSSVIIAECKSLKDRISESGHIFNNTMELINQTITIDVKSLKRSSEYLGLMDYFGEDKLSRRIDDELYHYLSIEYALKHRIKEVKYFFPSLTIENRKIIVFSNDCISSVQYILRGSKSTLLVHMRSSDVEGLLPLDIYNLSLILRKINKAYWVKTDEDWLNITIGSAHYYLLGGRD